MTGSEVRVVHNTTRQGNSLLLGPVNTWPWSNIPICVQHHWASKQSIISCHKITSWTHYVLSATYGNSTNQAGKQSLITQNYPLNPLWPKDTIWCCKFWSLLVQVRTWCLPGTKSLPEPMFTCHWWEPQEPYQCIIIQSNANKGYQSWQCILILSIFRSQWFKACLFSHTTGNIEKGTHSNIMENSGLWNAFSRTYSLFVEHVHGISKQRERVYKGHCNQPPKHLLSLDLHRTHVVLLPFLCRIYLAIIKNMFI